MKYKIHLYNLFLLLFVFIVCSFKLVEETKNEIKNIRLKNIDNTIVSLSNYKDAKGFIIVFTCNKCPMAKLYSNRLNKINEEYKNKGIFLLAINSMDTLAYAEESFKLMQKKAKKEKFTFPYLQDKKQTVAKQFNATHTPQAFIIWKNEKDKFIIKYQGAIDDNAAEPENATNLLTYSLNELLDGKTVSKPITESFGCRIYYRGEKQVHKN